MRTRLADLFIAFAIGFVLGAVLLAVAIPDDAWAVAWRYRGAA